MADKLRTRRHRRSAKAILAHGREAAPRHKLKAGRTGHVHTVRIRSRRRLRSMGPNPPANVPIVRLL